MNNYPESKLLEISRHFQIYGDLLHAEPCKIGHINETYIATYNQGGVQVRYVHQRINTHVFKDPEALMDNFVRVTSHQRRKLSESGARDASRRTLTVIPTRDNRSYYRNGNGECWRTLVFVDGVRTFEAVETPTLAFEAGKAFGEFCRASGSRKRFHTFTTHVIASKRFSRRSRRTTPTAPARRRRRSRSHSSRRRTSM